MLIIIIRKSQQNEQSKVREWDGGIKKNRGGVKDWVTDDNRVKGDETDSKFLSLKNL